MVCNWVLLLALAASSALAAVVPARPVEELEERGGLLDPKVIAPLALLGARAVVLPKLPAVLPPAVPKVGTPSVPRLGLAVPKLPAGK